MLKGKATVKNERGIHARPSSRIVEASNKYQSRIVVRYNDMELSTKEVLNLLMMSLSQGCEVEVEAEGPDEKEAFEEIRDLFETEFDFPPR